MKFNRIALALALAAPATIAAQAGVTLTPLLLGYHYTGEAHDDQRAFFRTNKNLNKLSTTGIDGPLNGGIAMEGGLYTGVGLGFELTPAIGLELEYGVATANGEANEESAKNPLNRFDMTQTNITGNLIITSDLITQNYASPFKPYVLVGGGQANYEVEAQRTYPTDSPAGYVVQAGDSYDVDHVIGNLGLGAYYRINDALTLRGEGRAIYNFDGEWVEGLALAGLNVVLGGHLMPNIPTPPQPEPEPEMDTGPDVIVEQPVDSDRDGVVDSMDKCPGTPPNTVVDANGCPKEIAEDLRMELRVFFDNDKSVIKNQYVPEIAKVSAKMKEYPNAVAQVEGHASKTGPSAAYNQRLSERRAKAVKSMMVSRYGVNPSRISTVGYGYSRPMAPNNTAEGRAMNRRVYAIITGTK